MALRGLSAMGGNVEKALMPSNVEKALMPSVECRTTFEGRLREEKTQLEERLKNVNAVLESLKKAPQVAEVLEALTKLDY